MHQLATYTPGTFDPYNPNQVVREPNNIYPGQYGTFVWNRAPTGTKQVLGDITDLTTWPTWLQVIVIGGLAATAGYYSVKYLGPKVGLAGPRLRDRRGRFLPR